MSFFEYIATNLNYLLIVILCLLIVTVASITASVVVRLYDLKQRITPPGDTESKEKAETKN